MRTDWITTRADLEDYIAAGLPIPEDPAETERLLALTWSGEPAPPARLPEEMLAKAEQIAASDCAHLFRTLVIDAAADEWTIQCRNCGLIRRKQGIKRD